MTYNILYFILLEEGRLAQLVRASALQAGGHKFESYIVHHAGVAQLVRASACHAEGRAFKSRHSRHSMVLFFVFAYLFIYLSICSSIG